MFSCRSRFDALCIKRREDFHFLHITFTTDCLQQRMMNMCASVYICVFDNVLDGYSDPVCVMSCRHLWLPFHTNRLEYYERIKCRSLLGPLSPSLLFSRVPLSFSRSVWCPVTHFMYHILCTLLCVWSFKSSSFFLQWLSFIVFFSLYRDKSNDTAAVGLIAQGSVH